MQVRRHSPVLLYRRQRQQVLVHFAPRSHVVEGGPRMPEVDNVVRISQSLAAADAAHVFLLRFLRRLINEVPGEGRSAFRRVRVAVGSLLPQ